MNDDVSLLKEVASKIRYRPLTSLIGLKVTINSYDTRISDIRESLGNLFPDECECLNSSGYGAIIKYGILDVVFRVPNTILASNYQNGFTVLQELGVIGSAQKITTIEEVEKMQDPSFYIDGSGLHYIWMFIDSNLTLFKLFFRGKSAFTSRSFLKRMILKSKRKRMSGVEFYRNLSLPHDYFPHRFKIVDACLTNSSSVWFEKHYYI
jgi:hypothetical protein